MQISSSHLTQNTSSSGSQSRSVEHLGPLPSSHLPSRYQARTIAHDLPSQQRARHEASMESTISTLDNFHVQSSLAHHLSHRQRLIYQM